ncbi:hypothetical protein, partial [Nitrosomonas europaea]|uniref:hypothetical protein n=1 Tax=Nitrosomonas europaea TaxID=915 RepID=UPI00079A354B
GPGGDTALCIERLRGGVGDIGARAIDLGKITHRIIGEGGGEVELAGAGIDHDGLRYVFVGRVIGSGGDDRTAGGDLAGLRGRQIEGRIAAGSIGERMCGNRTSETGITTSGVSPVSLCRIKSRY